jgi:Holliday junction resolvase RusA-like endonuclease
MEDVLARQVRISTAEAIAAGLLDPSVAELVKSRSGGRKKAKVQKKAKDPAEALVKGKPKRRRSVSRPAVHPKISAGPAGTGTFELDGQGLICNADFLFDLVPVPKERPRVVKDPATEKTFGYTPARTKHFTVEVARVINHVFGARKPIEGPVRIDMTFVMQVPKSWPKWKREAAVDGLIAPTGRPDMDNLEKALLDAFNETLIVDDAFVIERRARKIYGDVPQIMAQVRQTGQCDLNAKREAVEALRCLLSKKTPEK